MLDYLKNRGLSDRTKKALQFCHEGISKGKYLKQEYQLFNKLADSYLLKGEIREYPKKLFVYQYKLFDKSDSDYEKGGMK